MAFGRRSGEASQPWRLSAKLLMVSSVVTVLGFSGIEVTNAAGQKQPVGDASLNPKDKNQLIVPLTAELAPGKYTVAWHAVGDDTHKVDGKYSFEVKP